VFGELDWSPGVHEQCIGRVHRDGQTEKVVAYYLVSDRGSDPVVADVLGLKRAQIEGVRDPDASLIEKLETGGGHARRLAEAYLSKCGRDAAEVS
jgi:SNF2 family DNA or RNA helicase